MSNRRPREERRLLVTGASGCVGHYVVERLLADPRNRLHVLVRDPGRLRADLRERVVLVCGDLAAVADFAPLLAEMDGAVLAAASWGGPEARRINAEATWAILDALDPARCRRVVYLSTASVLDPGGHLVEAAATAGTEYIRSKYEAVRGLAGTRAAALVTTLYPTVVLGGDHRHPSSHAMVGLRHLMRHIGLLRWFSMEGRFHVVHAYDVARAAAHFLDAAPPPGPVVLGNPVLAVGEAIQQLAAIAGHGPARQVDLTRLALVLPRLAGRWFTPWDRHCLGQRDFSYPVLDLAALLGRSGYETLAGILEEAPAEQKEPACDPWPC